MKRRSIGKHKIKVWGGNTSRAAIPVVLGYDRGLGLVKQTLH